MLPIAGLALSQQTSTLTEVTVYRQGALVTRTGTLDLVTGEQTVTFAQLETDIVDNSVQLAIGSQVATFKLSVSQVRTPRAEQPATLMPLRTRLDSVDFALADVDAEIEAHQEALAVLAANRDLNTGSQTGTNANEVIAAAAAFQEASAKTRRDLARLTRAQRDLAETRAQIAAAIEAVRPAEDPLVGQITAQVLTDAAGQYDFELTYLVERAGWTSAYDLFVYDETETALPNTVDLTLVGEVYQATGVDWTGVDVTLSTGDPERTLRAPALVPYYTGETQVFRAGEVRRLSAYDPRPGGVRGTVIDDETNEPLIGANVVLEGTSLGTVTDFDGRFELFLPDALVNGAVLKFSYLGYEAVEYPVDGREVEVRLPAGATLDEVVVTGYGSGGDPEPTYTPKPPPPPATFARESDALITREFHVERPVSLAANGQPSALRLRNYRLPIQLRHRAVPRLDLSAYLEGVVTGYDSLGLSAGQLRVHYAGRYLGDDYLDPNAGTRDTLTVALGADDLVRLRREALDQERDRRALSSKVAYTLGYRITVQNTRARPIGLILEDQVPVSHRDDIKVDIEQLDGDPVLAKATGLLKWKMTVAPGAEEEVAVAYSMVAPGAVRVGFE